MGYPLSRPGMGYSPCPDLGWGTPHLDLGWGTPPRPGMGYPHLRKCGQTETITFPHPLDAGGNNKQHCYMSLNFETLQARSPRSWELSQRRNCIVHYCVCQTALFNVLLIILTIRSTTVENSQIVITLALAFFWLLIWDQKRSRTCCEFCYNESNFRLLFMVSHSQQSQA